METLKYFRRSGKSPKLAFYHKSSRWIGEAQALHPCLIRFCADTAPVSLGKQHFLKLSYDNELNQFLNEMQSPCMGIKWKEFL